MGVTEAGFVVFLLSAGSHKPDQQSGQVPEGIMLELFMPDTGHPETMKMRLVVGRLPDFH